MKIEKHELPYVGGLWLAAESLAPASLLTLDEEDDYIAEALPPTRLAEAEMILAWSPERRDRLRRLRAEFHLAWRVQEEPVAPGKIVAFPDPRPWWKRRQAAAHGVDVVADYNTAHFHRFPAAGGLALAELVEAEDGAWSRLTIQTSLEALRGAQLTYDFGPAGKGLLTLSQTGTPFAGHADIDARWEKLDLNRARVELAPGAEGD